MTSRPTVPEKPAVKADLSSDSKRFPGLNLSRTLPALAMAALVWLLLSGNAWQSWLVGLPAVLLAAWSAVRLRGTDQARIHLPGLLRFLPLFIRDSVLGGIDVVSRVMRPTMRIAPGFLDYRIRLSQPSARLLFINTLSLLPGTLASDLDGDKLHIHALDREADLEQELTRLERAVAAVYREVL